MTSYGSRAGSLKSKESPVCFNCPGCLKQEIKRTPHERKIAAKYKCTCGFEGPN